MYIPFLAKQKTNAWQLAILPCVFGMLFFFAVQPAGGYNGVIFLQLASVALLGGALALLSLALNGGLRACGIGMCLFLACVAGWAVYAHWQAQKTQGGPVRWLNVINFNAPMAVLAAAAGAYLLVCVARLLLPMKALTPDAQANFRSFFRIAGLGLLVFLCLVLFYGFFLIRVGSGDQRGLNLIPLRALRTWDILFLGNIFLFFPLGFFLRGLFRRGAWVSIALCAGFSLLMEVFQWVFAIGRSDIDDLLLNTLGATLGVAAIILLGALRKKITKGTEDSDFLAWA